MSTKSVDIDIKVLADTAPATAAAQTIESIGPAGEKAGQSATAALKSLGTAAEQAGQSATEAITGIGNAAADTAQAHESLGTAAIQAGQSATEAATVATEAITGMGNTATATASKLDDIAASAKKAADASGALANAQSGGASKATQTLGAITAASTGNISGMARSVGALSDKLGKVVMVAGAAFAGIKAGLAIQSFLWEKLVTDIKGIEPVLFKTKEQFDELNKVKLDTLSKEVGDIQKETNAVLSAIDKAVSRSSALRDAQAAAERARIMAEEPAGPGRDLKLAALDRDKAAADIAEKESAARKKLAELGKSEQAIQERLSKAEAADREVQEKAAQANKSLANRPASEARVKASKQRNDEAASSSAALAKLREQLTPQLTQVREEKADAQNQLAMAPLQRSAAGSTFSAAQQAAASEQAEAARKAAAKQTREALKAQIAAKEAEAKRLPLTMPMDNLFESADKEKADVTVADQAIRKFKSSGISSRSFSYQPQLRELEAMRQKEQAEADQAVATARETAQALGAALRSITQEIANLKSQMSNLEN